MPSSDPPRKPKRSKGDETPKTTDAADLETPTDSTKKPQPRPEKLPTVEPLLAKPPLVQTGPPPESSASPAVARVPPAADSTPTSSVQPSSKAEAPQPISPAHTGPMSTPSTALAPAAQTPESPSTIRSETLPRPKPVVAVARTLLVRNIEIGRKLGTHASRQTRQGWNTISTRVRTTTRSAAKPLKDIRTRTSTALGKPARGINNGLTGLQHKLENSDAAVIALTLGLIVACIVLTIFAVYWWNHS